jgi:hypothetical protein
MSEHPDTPAAPATDLIVEVVDLDSGARLAATVESMNDDRFVLLFAPAARIPSEASVRWFDGRSARRALARLEPIDATHVYGQLIPSHSWEQAPARRSQRALIDESQLLVRIVSSSTVPPGRRVHTTCLDISETGCRTTWPGRPPQVGDTLDLTLDRSATRGATELGWIAARVARTSRLPSGGSEVSFKFEVTRETQAARIREWHRNWLDRHS